MVISRAWLRLMLVYFYMCTINYLNTYLPISQCNCIIWWPRHPLSTISSNCNTGWSPLVLNLSASFVSPPYITHLSADTTLHRLPAYINRLYLPQCYLYIFSRDLYTPIFSPTVHVFIYPFYINLFVHLFTNLFINLSLSWLLSNLFSITIPSDIPFHLLFG